MMTIKVIISYFNFLGLEEDISEQLAINYNFWHIFQSEIGDDLAIFKESLMFNHPTVAVASSSVLIDDSFHQWIQEYVNYFSISEQNNIFGDTNERTHIFGISKTKFSRKYSINFLNLLGTSEHLEQIEALTNYYGTQFSVQFNSSCNNIICLREN